MIYDWYLIFNKTEFEALNLVSKEYRFTLQDVGQRTILVTKGNFISMVYEGIFLPLNLNELNPFEFEGHAIFIDQANNVYLGIGIDED